MSIFSVGFGSSTSSRPWTHVIPSDTTPEFYDKYLGWWLGLSGQDRMDWWLRRIHGTNVLRYKLLAARRPEANEAELMALWVEETYRDSMDAAVLANACQAIRERDFTPAAAVEQ